MASLFQQIHLCGIIRQITALYGDFLCSDDVPEFRVVQNTAGTYAYQHWVADVRVAALCAGLPGHRRILHRVAAHDASLAEPGSFLRHTGPHPLRFFLPDRINARCISILGQWFPGKAFYAHFPEPDSGWLRTQVFNDLVPLPDAVPVCAIHHPEPVEISPDLPEFYRNSA